MIAKSESVTIGCATRIPHIHGLSEKFVDSLANRKSNAFLSNFLVLIQAAMSIYYNSEKNSMLDMNSFPSNMSNGRAVRGRCQNVIKCGNFHLKFWLENVLKYRSMLLQVKIYFS